jgi:predicted lipoprotein with Yx(FWY)xxD motif
VPSRPLTLWLAAAAIAAVLAGCGSSSSGSGSSTTSSTPTTSTSSSTSTSTTSSSGASGASVSTRTISGLGPVLVNAKGLTLYIFEPDKHAKVTCLATCAQLWPPDKLSGAAKATGSGEVEASLLGSASDPEGGSVITYDGWPLYAYVSDAEPGQVNGQGLETNGGLWYVIAPSGKVITTTR